ncbi:MAG: ATP-binding protein [Pseudomonadota bacterium]
MAFKAFSIRLGARLVIAGLLLSLLFWLLYQPGLFAAALIAAAILVVVVIELWHFVSRTNRELSRFLDAARHADYSQRFKMDSLGAGFPELGEAFTDILNRMRERSLSQTVESRQLRALIEHVPIPLMTLHADRSITLRNNAARRLFGSAHVTQLDDVKQFGRSFYDSIDESIPGERRLVSFVVDGIEHRLTLATTEVIYEGVSERLFSLQDIESELDATQAEAWQDLVTVLTHEIMNSITPITSLSATSVDLAKDLKKQLPINAASSDDVADLQDALETIARRSDSLMQFVENYRQITRLVPPEKKRVPIDDLFQSVSQLATAEWQDPRVTLTTNIEPASLYVFADRDLLEPVLLNLLRNAWQATTQSGEPVIRLHAQLNQRGNVVITVHDNGPGIDPDLVNKIFVPFYTTRTNGSGVGLALARRVMIAHGGFIRLTENGEQGAAFALTF